MTFAPALAVIAAQCNNRRASAGEDIVDEPERLRRPDPERDGPIRNVMAYIRMTRAASQAASAPPEDNAKTSPEDLVSRGVKLGYAVIDDEIRKGERFAQELRRATVMPNSTPATEIRTL